MTKHLLDHLDVRAGRNGKARGRVPQVVWRDPGNTRDPAGDEAPSIWRVPRVHSTAVAAGTAILGDWAQTEIIVREDATLAVDRSGDNFTHNLATLRLEGRFGFAVKRPNAFAEIALAAA